MLYYYCSAVAALYNDVLYDDRMVAAAAVGRSWNSIEEVDVQDRTTAHYYSPHLNNTEKLLLLLLLMLLLEEEKLSNDDDDRPILLARKAVIVVVWIVKRRSSCDAPWENEYVERGEGETARERENGKN
jgi:hypothetical protein